jgi:hypothetical protein
MPRGLTITQISRDLHLDRKTARHCAAAADPVGLRARIEEGGRLDPDPPGKLLPRAHRP